MANGFGLDPPVWTLSVSQAARTRASAWCAEQGISTGLHPGDDGCTMVVFGVGAMDVERQWPPSYFAALAAKLHQAAPDLKIVLMGASSERPIVEAVLADPAAPAGLISAMLPLDEALALIGSARAYIGNDTSLLNIAAACGRPAIGIFAQTEPLDYSDNIIPVALPDGRFGETGAIRRISAAQAFDVVAAVLETADASPDAVK